MQKQRRRDENGLDSDSMPSCLTVSVSKVFANSTRARVPAPRDTDKVDQLLIHAQPSTNDPPFS